MDYGPFFSGLYNFKFIAIKLGKTDGKTNEAAICFDTEMLRMAAGWTGGFIKLPKQRDGFEGHPSEDGELLFSNPTLPGWAKDESFDDPRPQFLGHPYGSLPKNWAHYRGLYVHGEKVILFYSVGQSRVLEMPEFERINGVPVFSFTFQIDRSPIPMALEICRDNGSQSATLAGLPALVKEDPSNPDNSTATVAALCGNIQSASRGGSHSIQLHLPPFDHPLLFKVMLTTGSKANATNFANLMTNSFSLMDLKTLCRGGPAHWPDELTTKGVLGTEKGAYVVDKLTLPEENPWKSWIRPSGLDFFSDGRAAICSVSGDVWVVSGIEGKLDKLKWKRFATGLFQPLGLKIVHDEIYVLGRDQITRLHDLNGDGEADYYENFNNDVSTYANYHEFCYDLQTDSEGNFYFAKGSNIKPQPTAPHQGTLLRVSKDGKELEVIANGLRAPNGISVGPHDEIIVSDNQGNWIPSSRINWIEKGGFYGYIPTAYANDPEKLQRPPYFWLPMTVDNSSGGSVWVAGDKWGPFQGHLLHTSFGTCSLFHVMGETKDRQHQAGVVQFPLRFDSGIMRGRFNPRDGQLYLCGLSGWQTRAVKEGGLYRVRYTGAPVYMPYEMHIEKNAIQITFTCDLKQSEAANPDNYAIEQWNYLWTERYGSEDFSPTHEFEKKHDTVEIKSVKLSGKRTVIIETAALNPVMQMKIKFGITAVDETPLHQEIYNTINFVPQK